MSDTPNSSPTTSAESAAGALAADQAVEVESPSASAAPVRRELAPLACAVATTSMMFGMLFVNAVANVALDGVYAKTAATTFFAVGGVALLMQRGMKLSVSGGRADVGTVCAALVIGVALAMFGVGFLGVAQDLSPWAARMQTQYVVALRPLLQPENPSAIPSVLLAVALMPSLMEEWLFRGVMRESLAGYSQAYRVVVIGLLFGAAHGSLLHAIPLAYIGMVLTVLSDRTEGFGAAIVAHAALNATNGVLAPRIWPDAELPSLWISAVLLAIGASVATLLVARLSQN